MIKDNIRSVFKITIIIDAPKQTVMDMSYNGQECIKSQCELNNLYIENIDYVTDMTEDCDPVEVYLNTLKD